MLQYASRFILAVIYAKKMIASQMYEYRIADKNNLSL